MIHSYLYSIKHTWILTKLVLHWYIWLARRYGCERVIIIHRPQYGATVHLFIGTGIVGAKAKTPPFTRGLRCSRWSNGDKTGRDTLRPIRHQTKACDEVIPPCGLVQLGGPRVIRPIVTGPAWPLRVTGLICKGIPVITVCNPALWEYSGDNLGVWGHMRP
jgi:hypothetical protein